MVALVIVQIPVDFLMEAFNIATLMILKGEILKSFELTQRQELAMLFLKINDYGVLTLELFWGLWLFPLGYLVVKSTYIPRILGILLVVAGFGYVIESFATFFISGYRGTISDFTFWGELFFLLYLLIRGVNVERWGKRALASA